MHDRLRGVPAPNLPLGVVVTGLACNEETQRLFISHSNNVIHTYGAVGCSLTLQSSCTLTLPSNHMVTGLATDDANQLIFIGSSPWNGPGPVSEVNIALQAAPCAPVCFPTQVVDCSGFNVPFITGLGYDPCRQSLIVSDLSQVTVMQDLHPCGGFLPLNCCSGVPGQTHRSLRPPVDGDEQRVALLQRQRTRLPRDAASAPRRSRDRNSASPSS